MDKMERSIEMNELLNVNYNEDRATISARELHKCLKLKNYLNYYLIALRYKYKKAFAR